MWQQSMGVTCSLTGRTELAFEIKKKKCFSRRRNQAYTHNHIPSGQNCLFNTFLFIRAKVFLFKILFLSSQLDNDFMATSKRLVKLVSLIFILKWKKKGFYVTREFFSFLHRNNLILQKKWMVWRNKVANFKERKKEKNNKYFEGLFKTTYYIHDSCLRLKEPCKPFVITRPIDTRSLDQGTYTNLNCRTFF